MENQTLKLGIVERADELQPVPNARLVVYRRRRGSGGLFHHVTVEPDQPYRRSLTERLYDLVAWRVRADRFESKFSQRFEHVGMIHDLTLHFRLALTVPDPRRVVDLLTTDPLSRLQRETESLVGGQVRRFDLEDIRRHPTKMGQRALDLETGDIDGRPTSVRGRLVSAAGELGFQVHDVGIDCTLSERFLEPVVKRDEVERELSVLKSKKRVDDFEEDLEASKAIREEELEHTLAAIRRRGKAADALLARLDEAVGAIAGNISDPSDLRRLIEDMGNVVKQVREVVGSPARGSVAYLPGSSTALLTAGLDGVTHEESGLLSPVADLLGEAVRQIGSLPLEDGEKRWWMALVLSTVATALDESVEHGDAFAALEGGFVDLDTTSLSEAQWSFLDKLRDRHRLRQALEVEA